MRKILGTLKESYDHLDIIDNAFLKHPHTYSSLYKELDKELQNANEMVDGILFTNELYVGGKKRGPKYGYSRQMILSDVIQYIVNGRGYFYAKKSQEATENFVRIILLITNQLMLWDSLGTEIELRNKTLGELEKKLGKAFVKDEEMEKQLKALKKYKGPVGLPVSTLKVPKYVKIILDVEKDEKAKELMDSYYDSILPKPLGLWGELIVYAYLLRMNLGYIFPLLLTQEIISGDAKESLNPPDYLLLPRSIKNPKMLGIEVGAGKDIQSGIFSTVVGIPTATKVNMDNPKRCCICGKWILFCPYIIENFCDFNQKIENITKPVSCIDSNCPHYSKEQIIKGDCLYSCHQGGLSETPLMKTESSVEGYHFHLSCLLKTKKPKISENKIRAFYPYIKGLEKVEKLVLKDQKYKDKISNLESENKELKAQLKDLEKVVKKLKPKD